MTAFEVVADTALDEFQIEIVENKTLPLVIDERNPFHFQVDYKDGVWYCEGYYQCRENPEEYVTIRRAYSSETVAAISTFYEGMDEDDSDDVPDVIDDCTLKCLGIMRGGCQS